jgi:serine/threonine protein kinase
MPTRPYASELRVGVPGSLALPDVPFRSGQPGVPEIVRDDARGAYADEHEKGGTDVALPRPLRPGDRIGRFVVQQPLGQGGMGVVYGAVDPELGRRVAIKLVRTGNRGTHERLAARLRREALALARLSHPQIIAIHDIGTTGRGTFMAMEYVRGPNLRRWLRTAPRSTTEILEVFMQAAEGLAGAHAAGLVHRDFKPTNVMVGDDGRVKVLDFGLARGSPTEDPWLDAMDDSLLYKRMTKTDVVLGTTGYMAPEQLFGLDAGPRSDQFSFCVALFEALYGERPYPGGNLVEVAASFNSGRRFTPPRRRRVPARVRRVLARGLSLQPDERYPTMTDLLDDLRRRRSPRWRAAAGLAALLGTAWASAATTVWVTQPTPAVDPGICQVDTRGSWSEQSGTPVGR